MSQTALVADDHALFRSAVSALLRDCGIQRVFETDCFEMTMLSLRERRDTTLAVLDLFMPGLESASKLRAIRDEFPNVRIIVLTSSTSRRDALDALASGVHGFVRKTASLHEVTTAAMQVMDGKIYMPPDIAMCEEASAASDTQAGEHVIARLTPRQLEIINRVRSGLSNKQIARELGLAENTVKVHVNAAYRALGVRGRRLVSKLAEGHGAVDGTEPTSSSEIAADRLSNSTA